MSAAAVFVAFPELFNRIPDVERKHKKKCHDIQDVLFQPVGHYPYKFKEVKIHSPMQNISGLTYINGKYYEQVIQ